MTFIQSIPKQWTIKQLLDTPGRINMLNERVVTLIGIKRLESEALFVSSEGGGTLRETAKVNFAGQERYWWLARKVAGVMRRVLLSELQPKNCTVDAPCVDCEVCGLLGGLSAESGKTKSIFSRVKLQDLISVEPYEYDEKFRVRLPEDPNDPKKGNPVPYQEVVVPPGTHFPFIVRLIKPSQYDLGAFFYGNALADGLGYGNYSKLRGNATTEWIAIFDGFAHISAYDLLASNDLKTSMQAIIAKPAGPVNVEKTLHSTELDTYIRDVTSAKEKWVS